KMFVSESIMDSYMIWKPGDIVVIHAQTGTGKTYFALKELLPFVKSRGQRMLYLSNRSALKGQVEEQIKKQIEEQNDPELAMHITIMNYQSFELVSLGKNGNSGVAADIKNCKYWILDEAHYFLADASFNSDVLSCLNHIRAEHKNHVLIFMTATIEYLLLSLGQCGLFEKIKAPTFAFDNGINLTSYRCKGYLSNARLVYQLSATKNLLTYKEISDADFQRYNNYLQVREDLRAHPDNLFCQKAYQEVALDAYIVQPEKFQRKCQEYTNFFEKAKQEAFYYQADNGYTYVRPIYFKRFEQLCERIEKTPQKEKWLIFVSSKKNGEEIKNCLKNRKIECVTITADSKKRKLKNTAKQPEEYQVYQSIITDEKSPARVTISTSVLDNGVNLKDPQLKHIAILVMNPTMFLQMLGRKRCIAPDDRVNVYFQMKDIGEIKAFFNQNILKYVKFLVELRFVNDFDDSNPFNYSAYSNWEDFSRAYQVNGNFRMPYCHYVKQVERVPKMHNERRVFTCRLFEPNPYMAVRLAYDYYRILALLEKFQNLPEDEQKVKKETLWIEHQLSWLGLEYDPTRWIDYGKHVKAKKIISKILTKNTDQPLSKNSQKKLKRAVSVAVTTSHPPLTVKIGQASIKKVNEALAELGYDKRVKSKNMSVQGKQRNYWIIVPVDEM
ncbi:MAG: DEAD/DEAH box helicase, partial [Roseburia sp.]